MQNSNSFVSKPERLRSTAFEKLGQIAYFWPHVKLMGGVGEMSESVFRPRPMT